MATESPSIKELALEIYEDSLRRLRNNKIHMWEEINNKFIRACLAEFMAMHMFVLLCCGCAMVTLNLPEPNLMMVAASFGFGILTLAQIFGPLSGGHINCAVSFALFLAGRISFIKALCYTLSQMLGAVMGALFLWAIFGNNWPAARAFGSNSFDENIFTPGQVFFAESLGTSILIFNVLSTIDIPGGGPLGVYPIAMSVMIAHLFLIPIDGCSINPSRSFGPSLVATWAGIQGDYYRQQHIFWFGPLFGAALAVLFYEYLGLKPENFEGAKDMDTAIFQANKKRKAHIVDQSKVPHTEGAITHKALVQHDVAAPADDHHEESRRGRVTFQEVVPETVVSESDTDVKSPFHATPRSVSPPPPPHVSASINEEDENDDVDLS